MLKTIKISAIIIMMLGMVGCGKKNLGESYVQGSDYQYMFEGSDIFLLNNAWGSNGYFFIRGHYIYYLDDATKNLVPLCNKADCLHNEETDEERYKECNAHVVNPMIGITAGISYCNGYLYYIEAPQTGEGDTQKLYRIKEDGSEKQSIYQWRGNIVELWCIHRDVLYYSEHTYEVQKDAGENVQPNEKYAIKQLELNGIGKNSPHTLYELDKDLTVYSLTRLRAYGNHLYFVVHGTTMANSDLITDDNYLDYFYLKCMTYDIQKEKCYALTLPTNNTNIYISSVTFWKDKLIYSMYDYAQEMDGKIDIYMSDLDGSNIEIFQKDVIQGQNYISDGKYLYVSNSPLIWGGFEEKQQYKVYDKDMNLIDILGMPYQAAIDIEIGMEEGLYYFKENQEGTGADLMFFDKGTIGTYNGAAYSVEKIAEWNYSPEDLLELE